MALDQGIRGSEKKGGGKHGEVLGAWTAQASGIFLVHCELPSTWLAFNFHGFRLEAVQGSGVGGVARCGPAGTPDCSLSDSEAVLKLEAGGWESGERGSRDSVAWPLRSCGCLCPCLC